MHDGLVDVHAHFLPEVYADALTTAGVVHPDGMPAVPAWNEASALALMDRLGIDAAMLSISSPGVWLGDDVDAAVALARAVNTEAAALTARHPGRFGGFAALPLPSVDAALEEVSFALDHLRLDGVALLTNIGGTYLGDSAFDPLFDELNRRRAVVFLHPTSPTCWEAVSVRLPRPILEFPFDTTRAVSNLVYSGTLSRCPDLRLIIPHAGGTLPFLLSRLAGAARLVPGAAERAPEGVADLLRRHFYDLAGSTDDAHLAALFTLVDVGQVLYGSDTPFTPDPAVADLLATLEASALVDEAGQRAIASGNARRLFPRLG